MTDNEIIYCFHNGCELLKNDDVDNVDISKLKGILENCAKNMLPYIHKYTTKKDCHKCKKNTAENYTLYTNCKFSYECEYTIEREKFVQR